ncbi:uncharacterized protein LOC141847576 isoform X2 [Curcuma longa]|uniref:uncharacterized protein LOC141847576 isoform X2 n=1 Tax=Curcuma longa TaxID=136217 RepID=UPI003D9E5891
MELKRKGDNVTGNSFLDIMRSLFKSFNQPVEGQGGGEGYQGRVPVYPGRDLPGRDQGSLYKFYSGEPFIDGKVVPYDPKYHEVWVRNNARPQERSWRRHTKFPKMPPNNRSGFPRRHSGFGSNGSSPDYPGDNVTGSSPAYPRGNPAGPPTGYQVNPRGYQGGSFATPPAYQGGSFARPGSHTSYPRGSPGYPRGNPAGPPAGYQVNPGGYQGGNQNNQQGGEGYQGGAPVYSGRDLPGRDQ